MSESGNLMVIGGHAGDAELMAGATVLKHTRAGHAATLVHMTPGEKGHPTLTPDEYAAQKRREAAAVAEALGAQAVFLPYKDGELPVNETVKFAVADLIRQHKPHVIITHWRGSMHKDHTATHDIVQDALFYAALPGFARELPPHYPAGGLYYAENWEDPLDFHIDIHIDVSEVFADYLRAIAGYAFVTESSFPYHRHYEALGILRGTLSGFQYAEAFMLPLINAGRRWRHFPGLEPAND